MTPALSEKAMAVIEAEKKKAARKYKITIDRLMKKLDEQIDAKETKFLKIKKSEYDPVKIKEIPAGVQLVMETAGEVLVAVDVSQLNIQLEARRDAEGHLGIKPKEKQEVEHKGNIILEVVNFSGNGQKPKAKRS